MADNAKYQILCDENLIPIEIHRVIGVTDKEEFISFPLDFPVNTPMNRIITEIAIKIENIRKSYS